MDHISESDWKLLRKEKDRILNEYCGRILQQAESIIHGRNASKFQSYIELSKFLDKKDKEIAAMFDDLRRSNALIKICHMFRYEALSLPELDRFSPATKERIQNLLSIAGTQ